jgi:Na+/proline symporter
LAVNVSSIGTLLEIANKLINALTGPLLGIYLLAMFSRRTAGTAALSGGLVGALASYLTAYHSSLSFYWPSTMGLVAAIVTSVMVTSLARERPTPKQLALTWASVMSRPEGAKPTADAVSSL